MGWLADLILFVRDYDREWGTREARRRNLRRLSIAIPIILAICVVLAVVAINAR